MRKPVVISLIAAAFCQQLSELVVSAKLTVPEQPHTHKEIRGREPQSVFAVAAIRMPRYRDFTVDAYLVKKATTRREQAKYR